MQVYLLVDLFEKAEGLYVYFLPRWDMESRSFGAMDAMDSDIHQDEAPLMFSDHGQDPKWDPKSGSIFFTSFGWGEISYPLVMTNIAIENGHL